MKIKLMLVLSVFGSAYTATRIPTTLPLAVSNESVVFPEQTTSIYVADERIARGVQKAIESDGFIMLLAARPQSVQLRYFDFSDLYDIGTVATILQVTPMPDGSIKVIVRGVSRASVYEAFVQNNILHADVKHLEYTQSSYEEVAQAQQAIVNLIDQAAQYNLGEFGILVKQESNPERLAQIVVEYLNLKGEKAQALLESPTHVELLRRIYATIAHQFGAMVMKEAMLKKTMDSIKENEKKYYLQEQMKNIKKELGTNEADDLATQLAALPLPDEIRKEADRQLSKLEQMPATMPEHSIIQGYLEWLIELPWGKETEDNLDIAHAHSILNNDHFGLDTIKDRILDYIAIRKLTKDNNAPILCFVGPPGTGKTSLARSIARSIGRNFQRLSVGGVRDEAEIRGHRRTYVAAMPGRIVDSIRKAGSMNPVILIDEIDKIGHSSIHGDPSSAMLEVLDPEQNSTFRDHYLGAPFDLSDVLFIATANTLETLPRPLLDRMEIIKVSGYTVEEKVAIARNYLIKKAIISAGLTNEKVEFSDAVLNSVITEYTRESGVRELERILKKLCAKSARHLIEHKRTLTFTPESLEQHLGPKKFEDSDTKGDHQVGITNGLAWTSVGGDILKIEAVIVPGKGKLILTGSLGDVMKESAQAALTYVRAHAHEFGIAPELFKRSDVHVHVPAGATPKDGPSAGVSLLSSILSAFTGRKINGDYAMTGELNLRGNVMPIGGVKEKILAAKRHAIAHVILPEKNKKDLVEFQDIIHDIDVIFVKHADEVVRHVLLPQEKSVRR